MFRYKYNATDNLNNKCKKKHGSIYAKFHDETHTYALEASLLCYLNINQYHVEALKPQTQIVAQGQYLDFIGGENDNN